MYLNNKCLAPISDEYSFSGALVEYKNKSILKPILNVEDNLLAPIIFNNHILNEIEFIQFILSRFSNSNLVKLWLLSKLEQDKIIINAKINKGTDELFNKIIKIENETIHKEYVKGINGYYGPIIIYRQFNKIIEDELNSKAIFEFNKSETDLNTKLFKEKNSNKFYTGCYIITFNNKFYYYIGSSTNLKNRIKTHALNIINYINAILIDDAQSKKDNPLNDMIKFYLKSSFSYLTFSESEINYLSRHANPTWGDNKQTVYTHSSDATAQNKNFYNILDAKFKNNKFELQELYKLGFNIKILYLSTNYLNLFKSIYPDYKINKGEWLLLSKITDFLSKILEESLILKFFPKLNISNKVIFKHYTWDDEFLDIYSKNNETAEYSKSNKYGIYILIEKKGSSHNLQNVFNENIPLIYRDKIEILIDISTLYNISNKYNLKPYEVLINLNKYHHYKTTNLKNPLKIVEINP